MKKGYTKPDILFESFSLSSTIAGSCGVDTNTHSQNLCYVEFGNLKVFTSKVQGCVNAEGPKKIVDSGVFAGVCYHVPTDGNNAFIS